MSNMEHTDSESLILEVEQNPCVYDYKHNDLKNQGTEERFLTI